LQRGFADHTSPDQWPYFAGFGLAAAYSNAEFRQKSRSFGGMFVSRKRPCVSQLDKPIRNQLIESLPFIVIQLPAPFPAPSIY